MSGLDVDPDGLGKSGENLDEVAASIKLIRDDYLDKVTSYHGCWGGGEFGEAFAKKYLPAVQDAKDGIAELSDALNGSAQSLKDAANGFRNRQEDVLETIQQHGGKQR